MIKRWSIYRANLDPVVGSEQGKSRPVLIISENAILNIVNVISLTSRKPNRSIYPNEAVIAAGNYGLGNESVVLCHQIRTLDKRRLSDFYGEIADQEIQKEIVEALCFQLAIAQNQE